MKKLFLFTLLFLVLLGYSQKKVTVYNFSSYAMKIYNIKTKPTNSTTGYPFYQGFQTYLYPNQSVTLANAGSTTKFPFYSTLTPPNGVNSYTYSWNKFIALNNYSNYTGLSLWNSLVGNTQVFDFLHFSVGSITGVGQTPFFIGITTPGGHVEKTGVWEANYYRDTLTATNYEDIIVFSDL